MSTGRVILEPQEGRERRHGAAAQERFDTDVFGLPWSTSVVGPQPAPEDLRDWGRKHTEDGLRDWYADARPAQHPTDVLLCQRSVITWARQDHTTYATRTQRQGNMEQTVRSQVDSLPAALR